MWISRKNKSQTLDTLILSVIEQNNEGLTGYAVMKELGRLIHPIPVPGTGTIYPRLDHLEKSAFIHKRGNLYEITPQGKTQVEIMIEEIIKTNLKHTRVFFRSLMRQLPFDKRTQYVGKFPGNFNFFSSLSEEKGQHPEERQPIFGQDSFRCHRSTKISRSLDDLMLAQYELDKAKKTIKKVAKREIIAINQQLKLIEQQIQEINQKTKSWTKIPIEADDNEDMDDR